MTYTEELKDDDANTTQDWSNYTTIYPVPLQEKIEFIVQGVMITCVCGLGLLANVICMFVMSRPALKKGRCASVNALLTSMAGVDIIVLICR